jgi:hypothetical protein
MTTCIFISSLSIRGEQMISFTSLPLYAKGKIPLTLRDGGWVGSRTNANAVKKRKSLVTVWKEVPAPSLQRLNYPCPQLVKAKVIPVLN